VPTFASTAEPAPSPSQVTPSEPRGAGTDDPPPGSVPAPPAPSINNPAPAPVVDPGPQPPLPTAPQTIGESRTEAPVAQVGANGQVIPLPPSTGQTRLVHPGDTNRIQRLGQLLIISAGALLIGQLALKRRIHGADSADDAVMNAAVDYLASREAFGRDS
jgi:hypothetical protein